LAKGLVHSCTVFGVEGFKDASAMTLCEAGITSVADCLKATKSDLQKILGLVNGAKLHTSLLAKIKEASPDTWIIAAPCWSRGFGKTKLSAVYDVEPDITKWSTLNKSIKGIGPDSLKQIQETAVVVHIDKPKKPVKGSVCMSGFRDAEMQAKLEAHGFAVSDSVNKNTVALFVADITKKTTKTETALKNEVPIYGRDKLALFLETQKN
jgi:NAD-dependent DNA ligase